MLFDTFIVSLEKNVEIWIFTMVLEKQILKSRPLNNHQSVPLGEYRVLYQTGLHTEPFKADTIVLLSKCCSYRLSGLFSSLIFSVERFPPALLMYQKFWHLHTRTFPKVPVLCFFGTNRKWLSEKDAKHEVIIRTTDNSKHLHLTTVDELVTHGFCVLNRDMTSCT